MRTLQLLSAITLIGSLTACSSSDKKDPILEEAAQYHNQATEVQEVIEQIDSLKTVLAAQKTPDSAARIATLDSLKTAFEEWEKNLVEVPGMPHDHKHDHGKGEHKHNHADATLKDLPAEQMLDLQRETLNNIKQIQTRLEATMP
jgi:chromosome segregation ATPase